METATFGAGCFWGVEETFRKLDGVVETSVGFMGGHYDKPSYEDVCWKDTGHAEVVQITFDPKKISFEKLLEIFWNSHDPTTKNRQGPDVGEQYRSVIFYHTKEQEEIAEKSKEKFNKKFNGKIVTQIVPAQEYYKAEEYHQKYYMKKGGGTCNV